MTKFWREIPEFLYQSERLSTLRDNKLNRHFHQKLSKKTDLGTIEYVINRAYLLCIVFMLDDDPLDDVFQNYIRFEGICDLSIACTLLRCYKIVHPECEKPIDEFIEGISQYIDLWDFSVDYKKYWQECKQLDFSPNPIDPGDLKVSYGMRNRLRLATFFYRQEDIREIINVYETKAEQLKILEIFKDQYDKDIIAIKNNENINCTTDNTFFKNLRQEIEDGSVIVPIKTKKQNAICSPDQPTHFEDAIQSNSHSYFESVIPIYLRTESLMKAWNELVKANILTKDYQLAEGTSKLAAKYIVEAFCHKKGMNMISWKPFEDFWGLRNLKAIKGTFNKELESKISKIFREL